MGSIYNQVNRVFELLPLAAVIEDRLICVHSSIGSCTSLREMEEIPRPLKLAENKKAQSMLWPESDNHFYGVIT